MLDINTYCSMYKYLSITDDIHFFILISKINKYKQINKPQFQKTTNYLIYRYFNNLTI